MKNIERPDRQSRCSRITIRCQVVARKSFNRHFACPSPYCQATTLISARFLRFTLSRHLSGQTDRRRRLGIPRFSLAKNRPPRAFCLHFFANRRRLPFWAFWDRFLYAADSQHRCLYVIASHSDRQVFFFHDFKNKKLRRIFI